MARTSSKIRKQGYTAEQVHTLELPELFYQLSKAHRIAASTGVHDDSSDFNGNLSWLDSLAAAEFGKWDVPTIKALTLPELTQESNEMRYSFDVTGDFLDVPAFLADEPEQWIFAEPERKPCGRVIRLAVEIGGMGCVDACTMANRGQAIIALINSLELAGHSVELTIVRAFRNVHGENYKFLIPIKHAGQAINMKRLQFMIGHPAFYRRCLFALSEFAQGHSIRGCMTWTESHAPEGFTHIRHDAGRAYSLDESLTWAKSLALELAAHN